MKEPSLRRMSLLLPFLVLWTGCETDESLPGDRNSRVVLQFSPGAYETTDIASWPGDVLLFDEGNCSAYQSTDASGALAPFRLLPGGVYGAGAVVSENRDNLVWDANPEVGSTTPDVTVGVQDMDAAVPDLLVGYAPGQSAVSGAGLAVSLKRAVSNLMIRLTNVPAGVTAVSVEVEELYDRVSLAGTYSRSGSGWGRKRIELTREESVFTNSAGTILFPNDTTASHVKMTCFLTTGDGAAVPCALTAEGRLEPGASVLLGANAALLADGQASAQISYLPWGATRDVSDNIPVGPVRNNRMYGVRIRTSDDTWRSVSVHNALVSNLDKRAANEADFTGSQRDTMAFVQFTDGFLKPVKVRVTKKVGTFTSVAVRPLSYNIAPTVIDNRTVEFELQNPKQKVSVEFDGNRQENLFVFPDVPDMNVPDPTDPSVLYYGPGEHNVGRITLQSYQTLYIAEGAIVYGDVRATNALGIHIRGRGILCSSKQPHGNNVRGPQINLERCSSVDISGITLRDSPQWSIRLSQCDWTYIDNVKQISWMMNSDGVDICNCSYVDVTNCFFRNYDDNVTCKNFGWNWRNTEHITVANNVFWADAAHCMLVGPEGGKDDGSTERTISDVVFRNNIVLENRETLNPYTGALGIMAANTGTFRDITFEDIIIEDIRGGRPFSVDFVNYNGYGDKVSNVLLKNITYTGTRANNPSIIRGYNATQCVDGITLDNLKFNGVRLLNGDNTYLKVYSYVYNITYR